MTGPTGGSAATHVETQRIHGRRLGRRPHDPQRRLLRLRDILTGVVPEHSPAAEHFSRVTDWGLWGNNVWGDCGPVSIGNARKLVTTYLLGAEQSPTQGDVLDLYKRSGNPNFDPVTDVDDNGVIMADMLTAVLNDGIGGVKGIAYAAVDVTNLDEVRAAIDIFGFLLLGVDLEIAQQRQTDAHLWDYRASGQWGGHAVLAGSYTSAARGADVSVITWAEVVGTTDAFWTHQVAEAYVLIWPEHLGTRAFREGVDLTELAVAYQQLTGRTMPTPVQPIPIPSPTPTPQPVDPKTAPYFATHGSHTFHQRHPFVRHDRGWATYADAVAAHMRPCRVCRPKP